MITIYLNLIGNSSKIFRLITIASFIFFSQGVFAQGKLFDNEKIEAAKVVFFTQKLGLSVDEAKLFWPIYNDYQREQDALRKAHRLKMISFRKVKEIDEMTDSDVQDLIYNDFNFKQRDLNIEKKYYNKLKASLPIKIVGKFYRAQEAFKRELLNQFRGCGPRRGTD